MKHSRRTAALGLLVMLPAAAGQTAPVPTPAQPVTAPAAPAAPTPAPAPIPVPQAEPAQPQPVLPAVHPSPAARPPVLGAPRQDGPPSLNQVSLFAVEAPAPREFRENDLVTIIISERASLNRTQKNESDKSYSVSGSVVSFPDLMKLLELRLQNGDRQNLANLDVDFDNEYEGEGKYRREDRLTARVTARVIEVKPNGTLVLESKTVVRSDNEEQVITLSGICRPDDISQTNTVQSSQMFGLDLNIQNAGDIKNTANKGVIPRVLDALFNF